MSLSRVLRPVAEEIDDRRKLLDRFTVDLLAFLACGEFRLADHSARCVSACPGYQCCRSFSEQVAPDVRVAVVERADVVVDPVGADMLAREMQVQ